MMSEAKVSLTASLCQKCFVLNLNSNFFVSGPPDGCSESSDDAHCITVTNFIDPKELSITDEEKELMRMAATAAAALAEDADVEPPGT